MGRRILFLNYILNCNENETIQKVFWAQVKDPVPNEWSSTVKNDLISLGLDRFSIEEIGTIKKNKLKELVRNACKETAFRYLKSQIKDKNMTKLINLKNDKLEMQEYLKCQNLSLKKKKIYSKLELECLM